MGNRQVVERFARALANRDVDAQVAELHEDYVCRYPQSGEVIRGRANWRAIIDNYPEGGGRTLPAHVERIVGTDDQFVTRPSWPAWTVVHLTGSGDDMILAGTLTYPNGETWHAISLYTLRNGKIWRETDYFAAPFEAAEWRAGYVEHEGTEQPA